MNKRKLNMLLLNADSTKNAIDAVRKGMAKIKNGKEFMISIWVGEEDDPIDIGFYAIEEKIVYEALCFYVWKVKKKRRAIMRKIRKLR